MTTTTLLELRDLMALKIAGGGFEKHRDSVIPGTSEQYCGQFVLSGAIETTLWGTRRSSGDQLRVLACLAEVCSAQQLAACERLLADGRAGNEGEAQRLVDLTRAVLPVRPSVKGTLHVERIA